MPEHHNEHERIKPPKENESAIDPICGMDVDITSSAIQHEHNGKIYYFCSFLYSWSAMSTVRLMQN